MKNKITSSIFNELAYLEEMDLENESHRLDKEYKESERREKQRQTWHKNNTGRTDGTRGSKSKEKP